jgi:hypothetical protein
MNQGEAREGPFGFLSRRLLLKLGLGGAGALLAGAGGLFALRGGAPPVSGLRVLSDHGYRTLRALARTHLPRSGPFAAGADDFDLARRFDEFLADEPEENIRDLRRALTLVEFGPLLFERRLRTFSNLDPAEQLEHWRAWNTDDPLLRRQVAFAFRKFFNLVFFDQEAVWPHIAYDGPSVGT